MEIDARVLDELELEKRVVYVALESAAPKTTGKGKKSATKTTKKTTTKHKTKSTTKVKGKPTSNAVTTTV